MLYEQDGCSMAGDDDADASGFAELGLAPGLCGALSGLGYEEPTPIQRAAVPPLIAGRDLVGQAATGTGKTAAFALPVLQRISGRSGPAGVLALILVPTRELAIQVSEAMHRYGRDMSVRVAPFIASPSQPSTSSFTTTGSSPGRSNWSIVKTRVFPVAADSM